jgi:hypothetical protein
LTGQSAGEYATFVPDSRPLSAINSSGEIHAGGYGWTNRAAGNGTLGVFVFQAAAAGTALITTAKKTGANPFGNVLQPTGGAEFYPTLIGQPLTITILNAASALVIRGWRWRSGTELVLEWTSVVGKLYGIRKTAELRQGFGEWDAQHVAATPPMNVYTVAVGTASCGYYRVVLEP